MKRAPSEDRVLAIMVPLKLGTAAAPCSLSLSALSQSDSIWPLFNRTTRQHTSVLHSPTDAQKLHSVWSGNIYSDRSEDWKFGPDVLWASVQQYNLKCFKSHKKSQTINGQSQDFWKMRKKLNVFVFATFSSHLCQVFFHVFKCLEKYLNSNI